MKKLFLIVLLFLIGKISYSQYPNSFGVSNSNTQYYVKGGFGADSSFVFRTAFADTTAANRGWLDGIPGCFIRTTGNFLWVRNDAATAWVYVGGGAGTGTNIYNSNGTLTGNRTVSGNNLYNISFDGVSAFRSEANIGTGKISSFLVATDSIFFQPNEGIFIIDSLASGASTDSVLVWTQATGRVKKRNASSFVTANAWGLPGNSGTTAGTNFVGTTDNINLVFKRNSVQSGLLGTTNTSFGVSALLPATTGTYATALGVNALSSNTTGIYNTAVGAYSANLNTTGNRNTSVGYQALANNTVGVQNTSVGTLSMQFNTIGNYNTALGFEALNTNDTAHLNTAIGYHAMFYNLSGSQNVATGANALLNNSSGIKNTATGAGALENNTTGQENVAVGQDAALNNTTGIYNNYFGVNAKGGSNGTGNNIIGYYSGASLTAGNQYNVGIGHNALYHASQKVDATKSTAIGYNAYTTANNQLSISDSTTRFTFPGVSRGTANYVLTDSLGTGQYWVARPVGAATSVPLSGITAATASNDINNVNFPQTWRWNSKNNYGLQLMATTTSDPATQALLHVELDGANASSGRTTWAASISNGHSGTNSTNVALNLNASNGTNNYGLLVSAGSVGIGTSTPTSLLHVNGVAQIGTAGSTLGQILMSGNTSGTVTLQPAAAAGTWTLTLPDNDGDANQVLTTNGSGVTSWATASGGSPAGNFGNLQLNRNSAFATPASDSLDFESATGLSVKGDVRTTTSLYLPSSSSEGLRFGGTVRLYDDGSKIRISPSVGTLQFFTSGSNANIQMYNGAGDSYFGFTPLSGTGSTFETVGSATNMKMQTVSAHTLMIGNGTAVAKTNILSTTEQLRLMYDASNYVAHTVSSAGVYTVAPTGASVTVTKPVVLKNYTVATLPTGVQGMICYVTDATAPTYGATLVGGGAVVTMAFFDGTNWTAH